LRRSRCSEHTRDFASATRSSARFEKQLTIEAHTLSANVDREIIGEIERLQALSASPSLRQGDFAEFQRQAEAQWPGLAERGHRSDPQDDPAGDARACQRY